ncbi:hypothetical protein LCGC14_2020030, partial [marine sediment metagenome]
MEETGLKEVEHIPNIAGFWRRSFAFSIDAALLITAGSGLGYFAMDWLAAMGPWGQAIGIAAALIYFGAGDSRAGGGGSPGKRLTGLWVVDRSGNPLSIERATLRNIVFILPFMVDARCLSCTAGVEIALGALVYGGGGAMFALFATNRQTRQSIHDLVAQSFVIKGKGPSPPVHDPVWRGHYVIAALVAASITTLIAVSTMEQADSGKRDQIARISGVLEAQEGVSSVTVLAGEVIANRKPIGFVQLTIRLDERPALGLEDEAARLTGLAMRKVPEAFEVNKVGVRIAYGYNIGIAV